MFDAPYRRSCHRSRTPFVFVAEYGEIYGARKIAVTFSMAGGVSFCPAFQSDPISDLYFASSVPALNYVSHFWLHSRQFWWL